MPCSALGDGTRKPFETLREYLTVDSLVPTKASTFLRKGQDCEEVDGEVVPSWVSWGRRAVHKLLSVFKKKKKSLSDAKVFILNRAGWSTGPAVQVTSL